MVSLSRDELLSRFRDLRVWRSGGERAPNKPLLVLWALARIQRHASRLGAFAEVDAPLRRLLQEFGPPRRSVKPEYPFWHLRADQVWEVPGGDTYAAELGRESPTRSFLLRKDAVGGFTPEVQEAFERDPALVRLVAAELLQAHFPESIHDEILAEVGLDLGSTSTRIERDPRFRKHVLEAYGRACAVCGFDGHLSTGPFGLDAAHVMWKQAGGPDEVTNGIAMCVLHHRAFDRGVIALDPERRVLVSADLVGSRIGPGFLDLHGRPLHRPHADGLLVAREHLEWHRVQVFRAPARGVIET